ncbi:MAG: class I SAM-dependent methyltransferase [Pyrinomonadaceae bacterium]
MSETHNACPLCDSPGTAALEKDGYVIFDCVSCGHRFLPVTDPGKHVAEVYDDSYFEGGGAGYSDYLIEERMLIERGMMYADLLSSISIETGTMLDIGASAGCILKGFVERGWRGRGIEPNGKMARIGSDRYGIEIAEGDFESYVTDEKFDLVSMIQVAGHLYDPKAAFQKAFEILRPGGALLVETWNRDSLLARMFGRFWHEYSPPSVVQWFSEDGLESFLNLLGFEKWHGGRPEKTISGEHARSLLEYKYGNFPLFKLIPSRVRFPYPSEDLFWAVYGKPRVKSAQESEKND